MGGCCSSQGGKDTRRIVLLGRAGDGKSASGNTILKGNYFETENGPNSVTTDCTSERRWVRGRHIEVVDTPGFSDGKSKKEIKKKLVQCITKCSEGVHAFILVLKAMRYTTQEMEVVKKIVETFGEQALKYTVILFTRGEELNRGETIDQFVEKNEDLQKLVAKCGGRCHVIDNKYWKGCHSYRSNTVQVAALLRSIDNMIEEYDGQCYSNEMLQAVKEKIEATMEEIKAEEGNENMSEDDVRKEAEKRVSNKILVKVASVASGVLFGALLGVGLSAILSFLTAITIGRSKGGGAAATAASLVSSTAGLASAGPAIGMNAAFSAVTGGVKGGMEGAKAAKEAQTAGEAVKLTLKANIKLVKEKYAEAEKELNPQGKQKDSKKEDEKKSDKKKDDEKKDDGKKADEKKDDGKKTDGKKEDDKTDGKKNDEKKANGKKNSDK